MSSTNRGAVRADFDHYATPPAVVRDALAAFHYLHPGALTRSTIALDPCAGGTKTTGPSSMPYPAILQAQYRIACATLDIREDSAAAQIGDYLQTPIRRIMEDEPTLIITNPPFSHAAQIIEKALCEVADGGWVVMLARLALLESKKRIPFWQLVGMPNEILVHAERISFSGGRADSTAYAHFCWCSGTPLWNRPSRTSIIEDVLAQAAIANFKD